MEKLYTIAEVAKYFKVSRVTIYNWRDEGRIKFIKIGKCTRIPESELKRIVEGE